MALKCSYCSRENPDGSAFCQYCSRMLQATDPRIATQQAFSGGNSSQWQQQQAYPGANTRGLPPQQGSAYPGNTGSYPPPPTLSVPVQMGTTTGAIKQPLARRAFAGSGTTIEHVSWLLDGEEAKAKAIFDAAREMLMVRKQEVLELKVEGSPLKETSVRMDQDEERLYLILKRGVASIFLYIAPVGRNLYISRTTAVLPLISLMRVVMLAIGALATIVFLANISQGAAALLYAPSIVSTLLLILLSGLVSLFFFWLPVVRLLIPSIAHAIREKDFWFYLREGSLTSFQVDDVIVLERLTDDILEKAVERAGLNRDLIGHSEERYRAKRQVRGF